jgi:hypothetical protein
VQAAMGNILRLLIKREEEDHGEYYLPISRPQYYGGGDQLAAAPRLQPRPRQQIPLTGNRLLCRLPSAVVAAHGPAERLVQHSGDGRLTAEDLNPLTDPPVINLVNLCFPLLPLCISTVCMYLSVLFLFRLERERERLYNHFAPLDESAQ